MSTVEGHPEQSMWSFLPCLCYPLSTEITLNTLRINDSSVKIWYIESSKYKTPHKIPLIPSFGIWRSLGLSTTLWQSTIGLPRLFLCSSSTRTFKECSEDRRTQDPPSVLQNGSESNWLQVRKRFEHTRHTYVRFNGTPYTTSAKLPCNFYEFDCLPLN